MKYFNFVNGGEIYMAKIFYILPKVGFYIWQLES